MFTLPINCAMKCLRDLARSWAEVLSLLGSRDRPGNTAELVILYMYCTVLYCPGGYLCEMETRLDNALVQYMNKGSMTLSL